jgi:hypothetical protein
MTSKPKLTREEKARQLFDAGTKPTKTVDGWTVPGSNGASYEVREEIDGEWLCSCPDFQFRGYGGAATDLCKHIQFVRLYLDYVGGKQISQEKKTCATCANSGRNGQAAYGPYVWCSWERAVKEPSDVCGRWSVHDEIKEAGLVVVV